MASRAGKSPKATSDPLAKDRGYWGHLTGKRQLVPDRSMADDVEELLDRGFSKQMIADLLQVGITEVMRWQSSATWLPEEKKRASRLLAFCEMLEDKFGVASAASWFEKSLVRSCIITMQEVYPNAHADLVLNYAARRITGEQVLDAYDPAWREAPPSMWEVAMGTDGEAYIRMKGDGLG